MIRIYLVCFCHFHHCIGHGACLYSIVRTASASKANVLCYLRYVLEEMPRHLSGTDFSFLDDMMPWSEKYRRYEECQAQAPPCYIYKYLSSFFFVLKDTNYLTLTVFS